MTVTLIHCTPDAEKLVVKMARVSNPENAENWETGPKLLQYLIKHQHWSPFEMVSMCVQIETQRDIAAQILRHRSFTFQEFSTRYAKTALAEIPKFRRQDTKNRQNSTDDLPAEAEEAFTHYTASAFVGIFRLYEDMLQAGVAKETARRILPLCTPTTLYMHGTLRSWIHYIQLRSQAGTQLEHRAIAQQCGEIVRQQFPVIWEAALKG